MTRQQRRARDRSYQPNASTTLESQYLKAARQNPAQLRLMLMNFSRTPKGQKRTELPRDSIWPEGRTVRPGRMA